MQICEYFFENACCSVTKYYLCKQNNKRSLLGRKQRHQVVRSFPNRYLFSYTNKVTSLFSISCILDIIFALQVGLFYHPVCKQLKINQLQNRSHPYKDDTRNLNQHISSAMENPEARLLYADIRSTTKSSFRLWKKGKVC